MGSQGSQYKLYLHLEGQDEFTLVYRYQADGGRTVADLRTAFAVAYNSRKQATRVLSAEQLHVVSDKGARADLTSQLEQLFASGSDVFVEIASPANAVPDRGRGPEPSQPVSLASQQAASAGHSAAAIGATEQRLREAPLVMPFMDRARDAEDKQHYRIAATIYQQVLYGL